MPDIETLHAERLMRWCFYTGTEMCPRDARESFGDVFVAIPFKQPYEDEYRFAIKEPLEALGFCVTTGIGTEFSYGLCCEICTNIQKARYVICNVSERNDNVFFELGLAYGLGKRVINIKNTTIRGEMVLPDPPSDLRWIYYERYASINELRNRLVAIFQEVRERH